MVNVEDFRSIDYLRMFPSFLPVRHVILTAIVSPVPCVHSRLVIATSKNLLQGAYLGRQVV
jgi:hypothetical protein